MIFTQEGKGVCKHFFGLFFSLKNYDSHLKSKHKTHSDMSVASGRSVCPTKPECIKLDMWPRTGEHSINILLSKQLQIISSISLLRRQLRSTASKNQTQHLTVNRWLSIRGDMKNWKIYAKMRLYISVHRHHLLVLILCVQPTLLGRPAPLRWVNAEDIKAVLMKINTIS